MSNDKEVSFKQILTVIPDDVLTKLAKDSGVDYCSKVLNGKLMFYLLLYGLLKVDRLSQRGLSDVYGSNLFRALFNIEGHRRLSHSSISDRLSSINLDFFINSYDYIYRLMSQLYTQREISSVNLLRVDSSLVAETSSHLKKGLFCGGTAESKKKMIKYSVCFDGTFASLIQLHTEDRYASEDLALPEVVKEHFRKFKNHSAVYLMDRGVQGLNSFRDMDERSITYVGRLLENRSLTELMKLNPDLLGTELETGKILVMDSSVNLKARTRKISKSGKEYKGTVLVDHPVRVIKIRLEKSGELLCFITNDWEKSALEISLCYRRRWDIEVFFRFLKQELNFSHLISMNENGIQVMMYMTLISAMLVMIYKRLNNVGFKTARRRIGLELEELIAAIYVVRSGWDLKKVGLEDP